MASESLAEPGLLAVVVQALGLGYQLLQPLLVAEVRAGLATRFDTGPTARASLALPRGVSPWIRPVTACSGVWVVSVLTRLRPERGIAARLLAESLYSHVPRKDESDGRIVRPNFSLVDHLVARASLRRKNHAPGVLEVSLRCDVVVGLDDVLGPILSRVDQLPLQHLTHALTKQANRSSLGSGPLLPTSCRCNRLECLRREQAASGVYTAQHGMAAHLPCRRSGDFSGPWEDPSTGGLYRRSLPVLAAAGCRNQAWLLPFPQPPTPRAQGPSNNGPCGFGSGRDPNPHPPPGACHVFLQPTYFGPNLTNKSRYDTRTSKKLFFMREHDPNGPWRPMENLADPMQGLL